MLTSRRVEIELHIDLVAGRAEAIEATFGDFFGDKDASHRHPSLPPRTADPKRIERSVHLGPADGYVEPTQIE